MHIEWERVAKPQDDGHDTDVMAYLLNRRFGWVKRQPTGDLQMCNGTVDVGPDPHNFGGPPMRCPYGTILEPDIPAHVAKVDEFLKPWATGYKSLQKFVDWYWPKFWPLSYHTKNPDDDFVLSHGNGCSSGHLEMCESSVVNPVYVTFNNPQGCAEGFYHEVGHLRLEALGISINSHDHALIENPIEDLYDSPVRFDVKRPMCAVIHGLYAWVMFTENDIACATYFGDVALSDSVLYIKTNVPKIRNGIDEVRRYARMTPNGIKFLDGLLEWSDDVATRGEAVLAANPSIR
jgi:hypothetical protein